MTYREYITLQCKKLNASESDITLLLVDQQTLIPEPDADVDVRTAKIAMCNEFATLLPMANVTQGGYSLSWNYDAVNKWYNTMCNELGIKSITKPQVHSRPRW